MTGICSFADHPRLPDHPILLRASVVKIRPSRIVSFVFISSKDFVPWSAFICGIGCPSSSTQSPPLLPFLCVSKVLFLAPFSVSPRLRGENLSLCSSVVKTLFPDPHSSAVREPNLLRFLLSSAFQRFCFLLLQP